MNGITRADAKLEVSVGWADLLDKVYDYLETFPQEPGGEIYIIEVKEKWGGLRIYTSEAPDAVFHFLLAIEAESFTVCEFCGKPGRPRATGWIKTMCQQCFEEYVNQRKGMPV